MFARRFLIACLAVAYVATMPLFGQLTQYNNADPFPLYSTIDPYAFLSTCERNHIKCYDEDCCPSYFRIAFSPYRQGAALSQNLKGQTVGLGNMKNPLYSPPIIPQNTVPVPNPSPAQGGWNMVGLFYDEDVQQELIRALDLDTAPCQTTLDLNLITSPEATDLKRNFGFFDVQGKYRKYGLRFEAEVRLYRALSMTIQTGIAHIHVQRSFNDLTCSSSGQNCPVHDCSPGSTCPPIDVTVDESTANADTCLNVGCCVDYADCRCKTTVIDKIMKERDKIAKILGLNIEPYDKTGMEDIQINFHIAPMYPVNETNDRWPFFIFTPFLSVGATFPTSPSTNPEVLFAIPFSNNGHYAFGSRGGFTIDFVDSIAIGSAFQITGFTSKTYVNYPVPTNELQSGMFPAKATMRIKPGLNWDFEAYMNAYHFLYNLSFYFQYVFVNHDKDHFNHILACASSPDQPLIPLCGKLRNESEWQYQAINAAFNYDLSPNFTIGIGFQIPVAGRNVYRSTTIIGSLQYEY